MSSGEINLEALREIYPTFSLGCFLKKPVTMDYLVESNQGRIGLGFIHQLSHSKSRLHKGFFRYIGVVRKIAMVRKE